MKQTFRLVFLMALAAAMAAAAFAPLAPSSMRTQHRPNMPLATTITFLPPAALQHQRKSVASVQTMGLFGLGAPEIAVILVAAAFLLGPQKLAELGKDAGKIAGELKEVPKEFQKGLEEGESSAQAMKNAIADVKPEEKKD